MTDYLASLDFDLTGLDLSGMTREEILSAMVEAALAGADHDDLDDPDAPFAWDESLHPRDERGRFTTSGGGGVSSEERASRRETAGKAARDFLTKTSPATKEELQALAGHLAALTVKQLHDLRREHALKDPRLLKADFVNALHGYFEKVRADAAAKAGSKVDIPVERVQGQASWDRPAVTYTVAGKSFHTKKEAGEYADKLRATSQDALAEAAKQRDFVKGVYADWRKSRDEAYTRQADAAEEHAARLEALAAAARESASPEQLARVRDAVDQLTRGGAPGIGSPGHARDVALVKGLASPPMKPAGTAGESRKSAVLKAAGASASHDGNIRNLAAIAAKHDTLDAAALEAERKGILDPVALAADQARRGERQGTSGADAYYRGVLESAYKGGSKPAPAPAHESVLGALRKLQEGEGVAVLARDLRKETGLRGPELDRAVIDLAERGQVALHRHDHPLLLTKPERDQLIRGEDGTYYTSLALRPGATPGAPAAEKPVKVTPAAPAAKAPAGPPEDLARGAAQAASTVNDHVGRNAQRAATLGEQVHALADMDTRVFDPILGDPVRSALARSAVGAGLHNEYLRRVDSALDSLRRYGDDPVQRARAAATVADAAAKIRDRAVPALRAMAEHDAADWYERHAAPLADAVAARLRERGLAGFSEDAPPALRPVRFVPGKFTPARQEVAT